MSTLLSVETGAALEKYFEFQEPHFQVGAPQDVVVGQVRKVVSKSQAHVQLQMNPLRRRTLMCGDRVTLVHGEQVLTLLVSAVLHPPSTHENH